MNYSAVWGRHMNDIQSGQKNDWRRVLKIPWIEKVKNEEVYVKMNEQRTLWKIIRERRETWIGHVIRNNMNG